TRPPLVAAGFILVLAAVASLLVLAIGINYRLVVGPTLIVALLVILHTARHERRLEAMPTTAAQAPSRRTRQALSKQKTWRGSERPPLQAQLRTISDRGRASRSGCSWRTCRADLASRSTRAKPKGGASRRGRTSARTAAAGWPRPTPTRARCTRQRQAEAGYRRPHRRGLRAGWRQRSRRAAIDSRSAGPCRQPLAGRSREAAAHSWLLRRH